MSDLRIVIEQVKSRDGTGLEYQASIDRQHHGIGETPARALFNATIAWMQWEDAQ